MFHSSTIQLSKSALQSNYNYIKNIIGKDVDISCVVKGNAYGHGIESFIDVAEMCGINHFSVYSSDEAYRIWLHNSTNSEIMIMGWIDEPEIEWAIENEIQFYVFNRERLEAAIKYSKKVSKPAIIHLEVETGMNRVGINKKEINNICQTIIDNRESLIIDGICTHYAGAESIANYVRIHNQNKQFKDFVKLMSAKNIIANRYHTASSAATISYPKMRNDFVRIGILMYGFWPSPETFIDHMTKHKLHLDPLKRIISWKSKLMSKKSVKRGQFVGYGNQFQAQRDMIVGVVPVGYSHGFARSLSNSGHVLIKGQWANVLGSVNMNLIIVGITDIPEAEIGDEVVLIGEQGERVITVHSFTEMTEHINYELLTRLPDNLPRVIVE
ncbi:MAG: alanine racemase [Bacteroidetes bacterium]|nr:alanine racemase [Bacteroidota bacterium]